MQYNLLEEQYVPRFSFESLVPCVMHAGFKKWKFNGS